MQLHIIQLNDMYSRTSVSVVSILSLCKLVLPNDWLGFSDMQINWQLEDVDNMHGVISYKPIQMLFQQVRLAERRFQIVFYMTRMFYLNYSWLLWPK